MSSREEDTDARLARLATATSALRPRAGFSARVMVAIGREQPSGFIDALWTSSRRFLPIAALAAAVSVVWAVESITTVDDTLAASYGSVDRDGE